MFKINTRENKWGKFNPDPKFNSIFKPNDKRIAITPDCKLQSAIGMITSADKKKYKRLSKKLDKK